MMVIGKRVVRTGQKATNKRVVKTGQKEYRFDLEVRGHLELNIPAGSKREAKRKAQRMYEGMSKSLPIDDLRNKSVTLQDLDEL